MCHKFLSLNFFTTLIFTLDWEKKKSLGESLAERRPYCLHSASLAYNFSGGKNKDKQQL